MSPTLELEGLSDPKKSWSEKGALGGEGAKRALQEKMECERISRLVSLPFSHAF